MNTSFIIRFVCFLLIIYLHQSDALVQNVSQIIASNGYPVEEYWAETSDGFVLSIIRIPFGRKSLNHAGKRPVVFMQHGLLDSCTTWVLNPPDESLGFIMADQGYDVFLGNVRGNTYSGKNKIYTVDQKEYWNLIDFDYMISEDLPTMISKALEVSGASKLTYIGHSQGTLMVFGGFSTNIPLAQKVNLFVALAPVAYVSHQESPLLSFLADINFGDWVAYFGEEDFLPNDWLVQLMAGTVCKEVPIMCADVIFLLTGFDTTNLNMSRIPFYVEHTPAGTSVRNMIHWSQLVVDRQLQKYDYGLIGNLEHYHSSVPPLYRPELLEASSGCPPMAFFTGSKDILADLEDIADLVAVLPDDNKPVVNLNEETYNHMDFVWGINAHKLIYPTLLKVTQKYANLE